MNLLLNPLCLLWMASRCFALRSDETFMALATGITEENLFQADFLEQIRARMEILEGTTVRWSVVWLPILTTCLPSIPVLRLHTMELSSLTRMFVHSTFWVVRPTDPRVYVSRLWTCFRKLDGISTIHIQEIWVFTETIGTATLLVSVWSIQQFPVSKLLQMIVLRSVDICFSIGQL